MWEAVGEETRAGQQWWGLAKQQQWPQCVGIQEQHCAHGPPDAQAQSCVSHVAGVQSFATCSAP